MVETDRAGFRRGRKLDKVGQPAADTAELFFDDVRVPASNLLGEENKGFVCLMQELAQERLIIAVYCAAKLERLLEQTLEYVKERKAFDGTVWDFQNTKFKLADVKAQAVAVRTLVDYYIGEHMRRRSTCRKPRSPSSSPPRRCGSASTTWCSCTAATATCWSTRLPAPSPTTASRACSAAPAKCCAT